MVFNTIVLVLSIPCALTIGGLSIGMANIYRDGLLVDQHIYLLVFSLLYFLIHYSFLIWGHKRELLNQNTIKYLCVADALAFGFSSLAVITALKYRLTDFYDLLMGAQLEIDDIASLIVSFIVLLAVLLRVAFVVWVRKKQKDSSVVN